MDELSTTPGPRRAWLLPLCGAWVAGLGAACGASQPAAQAVTEPRASTPASCSTDEQCVVIHRDCCACEPGYVAVLAGAEADHYRQTCGEQPTCSPCARHEAPSSLVGRCVAGQCAAVPAVAVEPEPVAATAAPEVVVVEPATESVEEGDVVCDASCRPMDQARCRPSGEPCTCGLIHQPFAGCRPRPNRPCRSARAFILSCDPRCCAR